MLVDFDEVLETEDGYVVDDLWFNLDQMRKCYARSSSSGSRGIEVAIQLVQDRSLAFADVDSRLFAYEVTPDHIARAELLGYDVAESALISGLSNCAYGPDVKQELQGWSAKLNEYGLFREFDDAEQFKALTDKRVRDHDPYAVFELLSLSPKPL
jgi:hypothetical protein